MNDKAQVVISDILIKSAEDVQQGMWCTGAWFTNKRQISMEMQENPLDVANIAETEVAYGDSEVFDNELSVDHLKSLQRCAEGSIALATIIAGENSMMYRKAVKAVERVLPDHCESCARTSVDYPDQPVSLNAHNDGHLYSVDEFEAGQKLSELFRDTAEKIITNQIIDLP